MNPFIQRNGEWVVKAKELVQAQQLRKKYQEIEDRLLADLKVLSENESSKGGGFVFTKSMRKGTVDYSLIAELKFVDLDLYRKAPSYSWRMSLEIEDGE